MTTKLKDLFDTFLNMAASSQKLGINLIRVAILIIFVWIGGLKFWNYEAEGIVPFVVNSPFMSFFYTKSAPEYKEYKLKEGEFNEAKHQWHVENNTYGFSHAGYYNDNRYFVVSRHYAGGMGTGPGKRRTRFPAAYGSRSSGDQRHGYYCGSDRCIIRLCATHIKEEIGTKSVYFNTLEAKNKHIETC